MIDTAFQDPLTKKLFFFSGEAPSPAKGFVALQPLAFKGAALASPSPLPLPLPRDRRGSLEPSGPAPLPGGRPCSTTHPPLPLAGQRFWVYQGPQVVGPRSLDKLGIGRDVGQIAGSLIRRQGRVLLFSGDQFWRYTGLGEGQPRTLGSPRLG